MTQETRAGSKKSRAFDALDTRVPGCAAGIVIGMDSDTLIEGIELEIVGSDIGE